MFPDYFLFVRGKVQPRPYNDQELEFKIISIVQLSELRDTMIREMSLRLPVERITEELVRGLTERVRAAKGETTLRLNVYDSEARVAVKLFSKSCRVSLSPDLVSYLEEQEIEYSIA